MPKAACLYCNEYLRQKKIRCTAKPILVNEPSIFLDDGSKFGAFKDHLALPRLLMTTDDCISGWIIYIRDF